VIFPSQMNFAIAQALVPAAEGYTTVDVGIEADKIASIGSQGPPPTATQTTNAQNQLLLPGFVNAHTHSSEIWQRGTIPPYPLELWIAELHEFSPPDPEQIYLGALATAVETLLSGGTTVVDHLVLIPGKEIETVEAAVRAYQEIGIRAFVGPLIQDQSLETGMPSGDSPTTSGDYYTSTEEILAMMGQVVERFHQPEAGLHVMVAPTGGQLCSDALFAGCMELSDRFDLCRHAHLLETKAQKMLAWEKYGCSAVEHLQRLGYLSERTSLAHCIWLDESDRQILADHRCTVVHNPLSNLRLGSGIAPILHYRQLGVNVAFGCDGAASNDAQDLLEAIKVGSLLHNTTDFDYRNWIHPREAVEMAALGGAKGLNLAGELGTLETGKQADLVLYDLTNLSLLPRTDPIGLLVMGRPSQAVNAAWVNGRQIVANGQVTTIDVDTLRQELFARSQWQVNRQSENVRQLEAPYRRVMGLSE